MTTLLERARRGEPLADLDITDLHCHVGRVDFTIPAPSADDLVAAMDRVGVARAVCSHVRCLFDQPERGNDAVRDAMAAHPGRILGYVILLPRSADWVRAEAERCVAAGFAGIKLHNSNGFPYTEPAYEPALALANERRMPVLLHTWGEPECFAQVRTLATKFPQAVFLLGHAGAANEPEYVKIANEFENVYLDLCFSQGPRGLAARLVAGAGADKVVWGSDATFLCLTQQIGKVLGAHLPDDIKLKLLSGNARHILGRIAR
jgi:uncharacterized protein